MIVIFAFLSLCKPTGWPCECGDTTPEACRRDADAIFEAQVESIYIRTHPVFTGLKLTQREITQYCVFIVKVLQVYKGSLPKYVKVATGIGTADGSAAPDCSFPFEIGERYLVYGRGKSQEYGGLLVTSICMGTSKMSKAGRYLRNLENKPPTKEDRLLDAFERGEPGSYKKLSNYYLSKSTASISGRIEGLTDLKKGRIGQLIYRLNKGNWEKLIKIIPEFCTRLTFTDRYYQF